MRIRGLIGLLLVFAGIDLWAVRAWRSESALWTHAYRVSPRSPLVTVNYARHLFLAGREDEARRMVMGARR